MFNHMINSYKCENHLIGKHLCGIVSMGSSMKRNLRVAVLGAGAVGVTTALEVQRELPTVECTILAQAFNRDTTSDIAAGLIFPSTDFHGPSYEITQQWFRDAYQWYDDLRLTESFENVGISPLEGYTLSKFGYSEVRTEYYDKVARCRRATVDELETISGGPWPYASHIETLMVECRKFLPWGLKIFQNRGGMIRNSNITSFDDVAKDYDLVFNCLGLGAKSLCNDKSLFPVKGQIIRVQAPSVKKFYVSDFNTYIIPRSDFVVLGGCRLFNDSSLAIDPYLSKCIRERCSEIQPELKSAKQIEEICGLRPQRSPVRVEPELINTSYGKIKVVHNYGHGGYGITTAPGTSKHAVSLGKDMHRASCKL